MKLVHLLTLLPLLALFNCDDPLPGDPPPARSGYFILCEGNYGQSNASLWSLDENLTEAQGPLIWDVNEHPLGDVAQSIYTQQDRLYLVINNSSTVEVLEVESDTLQQVSSLDLNGAGPRYMALDENRAFISCWNLQAILVLDLTTLEFQDTIQVAALPEDLIYENGRLYVTIPLAADWTTSDQVQVWVEAAEGFNLEESYQVVPGPTSLALDGEALYVASTYYDADWQSYAGISRIDLSGGSVTLNDLGPSTEYGSDLMLLNGQIYRSSATGILPVTADLDLDEAGGIGNYSGVYSASIVNDLIFLGLSDYLAPDDIIVLDASGSELARYQVGALPGMVAGFPVTD